MRGGTIPHTRSTHARHISAEFSLSPLCNLSLRNAQCRTDPTSRNQAQTSEREHHSDGLSCAAVCELASSGLEVEHTVGHQHTPVTMYSVEDLLISHGYKVPQRNSNNVPVSHSSSPHPATYEKCPPPRSDSRCEIGEKRKGHSGVNGYEGDSVYSRHAAARGFPSDAENRVRKQRTQDVDNGNLGDGRVPEDSLTTDSGFFDSHRGIHSQPRSDQDVSYWRRRGQDFCVLLDYADFRDPRRSGGGVPNKPEGMQRRPESALSTEEHNRERQRRAESARAREREMALHQWRIAAERKYQSLGTEEWRPMTSMSHQASENDLAQEQRRPRTAEGAVPPKPKSKSQSLPRMALQSESLQYFSIPNHRHDSYGSYRVNGHYKRDPNGRHLSDGENRERWTDRSGAQSAPPTKPRFSRPLRPPSYEVHQQMRGSAEMLSGELPPRARDRTPLPFSRQEYFVQELGGSEPPGYIPPPSYRRQPMVKGGHRTYPISMGAHQFRGDPYMQGSAMTEVKEWFFRQTGMAWPEQYRDGRRSVPCRRQAYPGYGEEWMGNVQYISFDDPRVRHISGAGVDGNSLTDADKIRNIRNEIPVKSEKSNDSAFPLTEKPFDCTEPSKSNISDCVNEDSIHKDVKELVSSNSTSDQHCNRHPVDRSNTIAIQMTVQQNSNQGFIETVTQVKKFEAKTVAENKSSSKKKFKETMFCLVSVPISMQANRVISDPNNNEKMANSIEHTVVEYKSQVGRETHIQSSSHLSVKSSNVSALTKENDTASKHFGQADKVSSEHWHGDHYKNQETQTGSPEVSRNTLTQSTEGVGPDCSTICEYPIGGQKDLNPSSNSAFSRTGSGSSSSIKSPTLPQSALPPSSPDHQPLLRKMGEKQPSADSQEVFGQFLLKPVNRRKWDAIGELESFNKEIQDKMKCPNVGKKIEQLDEALRNVLELSNTSRDATDAKQDNAILSMPQETQHLQKGQVTEKYGRQNNLNVTPNSGSIGHENTKRTKSSFTKVNVNLNTQTLETPAAKANYYANFEVMQTGHFDPGTHRQDIPVPKECLLKDVGLTVYTAIPDTVTSGSPTCLSPESPMLTSPSDNSEMYETLQITSSDSSGDLSRHSPELAEGNQSLNNNNTFKSKAPKEKDPGSRSAEVTRSGKSSRIHVIKSLHCRFQANYEDGDDHLYSDYLSWSNEKTLADEHLETLLSQEKANSMNTEDLSNLYQVQCAKGIPENESIEQRAARILGISVPVEALVVDQVDDKQLEVNSTPTTDSPAIALQTKEICLNEEKTIDGEFEKVTDGSVEECRRSYRDVVEVGLGENQEPKEDLTSSEKHNHRTSSVLELPEFPPSNLCLSLPLTEDKQLTLSVCRADLMETAVADVPDNQQNNLSPYLSPSSPNNFTSLDCCIFAKEEYSQLVESTMAKETEPKQCSEEGDQSESHGKTSKEEFEYFEKGSEPNTDVVEECGHMENEELVKGEGGTTDELIQENHQKPPKSLSRPIPHPRSGKVAKREITLSEGSLCQNPMYSGEDEDKPFLSDAYDPSRVERV